MRDKIKVGIEPKQISPLNGVNIWRYMPVKHYNLDVTEIGHFCVFREAEIATEISGLRPSISKLEWYLRWNYCNYLNWPNICIFCIALAR